MTESGGANLLKRLLNLFPGGNGSTANSQPSLPEEEGEERTGCSEVNEVSCREAVERVYEYLDGEMEPERAEEIRCHIQQCKRCYPMFDWERMFLDVIRERADRPEDNPELRQEVESMLERVAGS